ncbi:tripartite tricarboxylate transporter TctB family protein [Amorphus orientalis]|uniref:Glucose uptake protein GlcU n=1 Tax=Amorphus orientalis TaxID=649198 RepID=A0AAE4AQZ4_9HYPH|nr:tripartite tricarboxylate transporter TctB family protein [Amorphus orientalis]MDQ0313647.1 glucose uptake protein GlcU [Amorphus orientalis]
MQSDAPTTEGRDVGGLVAAIVLVLIGAIALYDTTGYADMDSVVFPRTVAIALILSSLGYIVYAILRRPPAEAHNTGSTLRRVSLVAVMLVSVAAMPWIGFVASGIVAFLCLILVAMHDPWTWQKAIVYPLVGIAIVVGFFALFRYGLLVPLPKGRLF